jgi:hypothetical protein
MSFPIVLTSSNRASSNSFKVNLSTTIDLSSYDVSVGQAFIYYSWFNINAQPLNNNRFTLTIPRNGGSDTLAITIPDGAYNISDLNNYLQFRLIQGGYYITNNSSGVNTYYAAFEINPTNYKVQFNTSPLPTSLPAGFTSAGMTFPASANQHYQMTVASDNNFKDIIGFNAGTYPAVATNVGTVSSESQNIPNVNPISSVQMRLSCVYNPFSSNSQLLHVFTNQGSRIGEIIDASPNYEQFVSCTGSHRELTLSFYDQLGNPLDVLDSNLTIKLVFKRRV